MTSLQVRLRPDQADLGADLLLDWFKGDKGPSTVGYKSDFLRDLDVSPVACDLLRIGGAVFVADKTVLRNATSDSWTRDIEVRVPVSAPALWTATADQLTRTLGFLSGDRWTFDFEELPPAPAEDGKSPRPQRRRARATTVPIGSFDTVCLFSGGLDSLAGAVDLLEAGHKPVFVGHHENGKPSRLQGDLFDEVEQVYGAVNCSLRRIYLAPRSKTAKQARPFPGARERTTRSRSFLFLSAAAALADAIGTGTRIVMPENGFIGINVPLTPARSGSLSTRTTHPQYVAHISTLFAKLGLDHPIENPYRLMTKGEILAASSSPSLLERLTPKSVSCSHPEAGRWRGGKAAQRQGNCGACYPCLIRAASLNHVGWNDACRIFNPLNAGQQPELLTPSKKTGASLRAVLDHLRRPASPFDVLRNGSIPNGEARAFSEVYMRGRDELSAWLRSGPSPLL